MKAMKGMKGGKGKVMKAMKGGKGKAMKAMKGGKDKKGAEKITYAAWEKRRHWHAWTKAKQDCDKDGIVGEEKKRKVSEVTKTEMDACRQMKIDGNLPPNVLP